jgi:hypothetical protein
MASVFFASNNHNVPLEWLQGVLIVLDSMGYTGLPLDPRIKKSQSIIPVPGLLKIGISHTVYEVPLNVWNSEQILIGIAYVLWAFGSHTVEKQLVMFEGLRRIEFDQRTEVPSGVMLRRIGTLAPTNYGTSFTSFYDNGMLQSISIKRQKLSTDDTNFETEHQIYYNRRGTLSTEIFRTEGIISRREGPAIIRYNSEGGHPDVEYQLRGLRHRLDGPAVIVYHPGGRVVREERYYIQGEPRRLNGGPTTIEYYPSGRKMYEVLGDDVKGYPDI